MEDRDLHAVAQFALNLETLWRLDVFQVDTAERRLQRGDDVAQLFRIVFVDFDIEDIDAGKFLEQHALAFHHRLRCQRADIAKAENGGAVGDNRNQVAACRVAECIGRVGHDFFASGSNAGRISQRQIALVRQQFGRGYAYFPGGWKLVILKRCLAQLLAELFFFINHRIHMPLSPSLNK